MKSLADFKRTMRVGSYWTTYHYAKKEKTPKRKVSVVTGRVFAFERILPNGKVIHEAAPWPLASAISFTKGGTIHIKGYINGLFKIIISYKEVKPPKHKKKNND